MKDFSRISTRDLKKTIAYIAVVVSAFFLFICFEFYIPVNPSSHLIVSFTIEKGWTNDVIAANLKKLGLIRSSYFFKLYALMSFKHVQMQAGEYDLSPKMSIHDIANKMAFGKIAENNIVILEGWTIKTIGQYLESKDICKQENFVYAANKEYSGDFDFLIDKPKSSSLEGYLFPDTYGISKDATCEDIIGLMLSNFSKKLTPELRVEISNQQKTVFEIVTMASVIEKEGRNISDKEIISGIFWKRISAGIALQSCATVNYITGKNDPGVSLQDMQIDSLYNTYKYRGLPKGPISNPGIDSIKSAIYPKQTDYWYFLADGKTIFSKTLQEHNEAKAKYLK